MMILKLKIKNKNGEFEIIQTVGLLNHILIK